MVSYSTAPFYKDADVKPATRPAHQPILPGDPHRADVADAARVANATDGGAASISATAASLPQAAAAAAGLPRPGVPTPASARHGGIPRPKPPSAAAITRRFHDTVERWVKNAPPDEVDSRDWARIRLHAARENGETKLFLNTMRLTSLPDCLSRIDTLTSLHVDGNQLARLPALPTTLRELDASENRLTVLPPLPAHLVKLDVSDNLLSSLPALPATLTDLCATNNQLTDLPALPPSLGTLWVGENALSALPALPATLTALVADSNHLTTLPALPPGLKMFFAQWNDLDTLPPLVDTLTSFSVQHNPLHTLPELPSALRWFIADQSPIDRTIAQWEAAIALKQASVLYPPAQSAPITSAAQGDFADLPASLIGEIVRHLGPASGDASRFSATSRFFRAMLADHADAERMEHHARSQIAFLRRSHL